jgi:hypothetical protein
VDYSISNLVSASVSWLRLTSEGCEQDSKALEILFRQFAAEKDSKIPALKEILLDCPAYVGRSYLDRCDALQMEAENASGDWEFLLSSSSSVKMEWEGKWYRIPLCKQKTFVDVEEV